LGSAKHFDPFDVVSQKVCKIECAVWDARITNVDAINEHLDVVRICPSHKDRCLTAQPSCLNHIESGYRIKRIRDRSALIALKVFGRDDRYRTRNFVLWSWNRRRADDDLRQSHAVGWRIVLSARGLREQRQRQAGAEQTYFHSHDATFLRLRAQWRRIG
jgi:hypothetical protein